MKNYIPNIFLKYFFVLLYSFEIKKRYIVQPLVDKQIIEYAAIPLKFNIK